MEPAIQRRRKPVTAQSTSALASVQENNTPLVDDYLIAGSQSKFANSIKYRDPLAMKIKSATDNKVCLSAALK